MRVHAMSADCFFGGNSVYRKSVLLECRGFHPDSMPNHLLMYRGDGETYVERFIREHGMKAMYYAQASVYHMIDVNRVSDSYINYMHLRIGISAIYTVLRENGLKAAFKLSIIDTVFALIRRKNIHIVRGEWYLLLYCTFYKRIREWIHKEDYF